MSSDIEIEIKIKLTKEKFNEMKRYFEWEIYKER